MKDIYSTKRASLGIYCAPMKMYLGDSVYVDVKHGGLELTTENGYGPTNTIFLEPEVYAALLEYVRNLEIRGVHRDVAI